MTATAATEALLMVVEKLLAEPPEPEELIVAGMLLLSHARLEVANDDELIKTHKAGLIYCTLAKRYATPTPGRLPGPGEDGGLNALEVQLQAELDAAERRRARLH